MNELREKKTLEQIQEEVLEILDSDTTNTKFAKMCLITKYIYDNYELTSLVDKPKVDTGELKECPTCGKVKESKPTPDGDEICPCCGDKEMVDYEVTQTPNLDGIKKKFDEQFKEDDDTVGIMSAEEYNYRILCVWNFFLPILATKEHDDKIREEAVERVFNWLSEANYDCTVQELYEKYLKGLSGDKR